MRKKIKITIERNDAYIFKVSLKEMLSKEKWEYVKETLEYDYDINNFRVNIYAICSSFRNGTVVNFYYEFCNYKFHDVSFGIFCEAYEDIEMKIKRVLPNIIMNEVDVEKLLEPLFKEDEGEEEIC